MLILGVSAWYHDSAAAIVRDGKIVAAAQEERFSRIKHDAGFPHGAVKFCLERAGVSLNDVDAIAFYEKPYRKFTRLLGTYLGFGRRGEATFEPAMNAWLKGGKIHQDRMIREALAEQGLGGWTGQILYSEHHLSHAASAFYPSPFDEAIVLTLDGVGEWATTTVSHGKGRELNIERELHFPHSIGLLYAALTDYTGFKVNSGEYKVMGLAPYGEPTFAHLIRDHLLDMKPDGTFRLNMDYFDFATGFAPTNAKFEALFGGPRRKPETELLTQRHMDLAASIQVVTEEIVLALTRSLAKETGAKNLCLAGGVALNCVANGKILRDGQFDKIWIQPAAGDAGGALGAALYAHYGHDKGQRVSPGGKDAMEGAYLGPDFAQADIEARLKAAGARFTVVSDSDVIDQTAQALADQKAIGWYQGRMEFGPRALGNRSIIADPRSPKMQKTLNLQVKYRESFRPFAPSILEEDVADWFELDEPSPYMLLVADVKAEHRRAMTAEENALFGIDKLNVPRSTIPAVTHVDYSARIQTVSADTNPRYHALISRFKALTDCPIVVNTSFNVRGEPIVCTPEDAFRCMMGSEIDYMAVGNCILLKEDQDPALKLDYKTSFELD
jgi:carbamoyltransferase